MVSNSQDHARSRCPPGRPRRRCRDRPLLEASPCSSDQWPAQGVISPCRTRLAHNTPAGSEAISQLWPEASYQEVSYAGETLYAALLRSMSLPHMASAGA